MRRGASRGDAPLDKKPKNYYKGHMDAEQFDKRTADRLVKISVASMAAGLFQGNEYTAGGLVVGALAILATTGWTTSVGNYEWVDRPRGSVIASAEP